MTPRQAKPFLITGLPRSRTAWMSAFFSFSEVLCRHEPLKELSDISEFPATFDSSIHTHIGASDSGAGYFLPWITAHIPMPIVIIARDIDEVKASMLAIDLPCDIGLDVLAERLAEFRRHESVLWVDFNSLNEKRIMERVFWHLLPGVPFDEERYNVFKSLRIEADVDEVKAIAQRRWRQQAHMLRDVLPLIKERQLCLG